MKFKAKWIWKKQRELNPYNQTILARKSFHLSQIKKASIKITADSWYRLFINGQWVNDGPCRSWPEHYKYDEIDVTKYLQRGENKIEVLARYFGIGDMHHVPMQAGLLAELSVIDKYSKRKLIISDDTWEAAEVKSFISNTPKDSIQMEPGEYYDARMERKLRFVKCMEICESDKGPWKDLQPRDVALLTKEPANFKKFLNANIVKNRDVFFTSHVARLMHPGVIEANINVSTPCIFATVLEVKKDCGFQIEAGGPRGKKCEIFINGKKSRGNKFKLSAGRHIVLIIVPNCPSHDKDITIRFIDPPEFKLENPVQKNHENPWCFIPFDKYTYIRNDIVWQTFIEEDDEQQQLIKSYAKKVRKISKQVYDVVTFRKMLGQRCKLLTYSQMFCPDPYMEFLYRKVIGTATALAANADGLIKDDTEITTVSPNKAGDVELVYDFGQQRCGYYTFKIESEAGVQIDIFGVEYITEDGKIQHTNYMRNGMRYVTKEGVNNYVSVKRRGGRYVFIRISNHKKEVRIRYFGLIESTYPVDHVGKFNCSDERLNNIRDISARTLELCMEDTFTDCPLFEQVMWVGDVKAEALYALEVFDARDIAKRCIRLAAESLEKLPMVGSQVPSCWENILPAWSFLWVISVWDYYWYSGEKDFLKSVWGSVVSNINGALEYTTDRGLFSGPFWNIFDLFERSAMDNEHKTVLHNSMLFVGAIDAAMKCAQVLGDNEYYRRLGRVRGDLRRAINKTWNKKQKCYPNSIHEDGTVSKSCCVHTSMLSILYDIAESGFAEDAIDNVIRPSLKTVGIGSPFAIHYLYEMLEKLSLKEKIVESILANYQPMLEAGATTVWEMFPGTGLVNDDFATRSHCHGSSAAAVYFLNHVILGIEQKTVGGKDFQVSPNLCGLSYAHGTTATIHGPVSVRWDRTGDVLNIRIEKPEGVNVKFVRNKSHEGLKIKNTIAAG